MIALLLLLVISTVGCAGPHHPPPTTAPAPAPAPTCREATPEALLAAISAERLEGLALDEEHARSRAATVELDGNAPAEAVLAVDSLISELDSELGEPRTALFVLRCAPEGWRLLDRLDLSIDAAWDGTLDARPGVVTLRAEPFDGVGHDFARVEQLDVRGGYDPRYVSRRFLLLHVVGDELVVALDRVVRTETESGPDREAGDTTVRTLVYRPGLPPRIRLRVRSIAPSGRSRPVCDTVLTFDGRSFVPADPRCE